MGTPKPHRLLKEKFENIQYSMRKERIFVHQKKVQRSPFDESWKKIINTMVLLKNLPWQTRYLAIASQFQTWPLHSRINNRAMYWGLRENKSRGAIVNRQLAPNVRKRRTSNARFKIDDPISQIISAKMKRGKREPTGHDDEFLFHALVNR